MKSLPPFIAAAALLICLDARADTYTVTNASDAAPGSLRQAILDANAHANGISVDRIAFNINSIGVQTIAPLSQLPDVTDPVVIDGFSQPGSVINSRAVDQPMNAELKVELSGKNVPTSSTIASYGLNITAGGCTVQGLVINRFTNQLVLRGNGSRVQGCYIGTDPGGTFAPINPQTQQPGEVGVGVTGSGNLIGATFNSGRNLISGSHTFNVEIVGSNATDNLVQGNLIGLKADGAAALAPNQSAYGVVSFLGAANNTIGGTAIAARNVISGHGPNGSGIALDSHNDTVIGNYVGTDIGGGRAVGNNIGIQANGSSNTIGGSAAGAGNVVSGNLTLGIYLKGDSNIVDGNRVGLGASSLPLGNGTDGIQIAGSNNFVGSPNAGDGNIIESNQEFGVYVTGTNSIGNQIRGNSIYRNGQLGIKLGSNAFTPTPNDAGDGDSGANGLQNYPTVTLASLSGNNVNVAGNLNSTPNTGFRIDFYTDTAADPSGYGEGRYYLGTALTATNGSGDAVFNLTVPYLNDMMVITATASANDGTSEFSKALGITGAPTHLLNIATRLGVQTGENVLISGFIITGHETKRMLIRGLGPSLPVAGHMNNPLLELYVGSNLFGMNDDWQSTQGADIAKTGIAPTDPREAAAIVELLPGSYTAILRGANGDTGIALLDAYDLDQTALAKFANVSTRGLVGQGDSVLIAGVIIGGAATGDAKVIFRALGPSLPGVANPLLDPKLELYNGNGVIMASNDDWKAEEAATTATGIPPKDDRESALVRTLSPGNYTALVRGKNNATGVAVVEAYNLP